MKDMVCQVSWCFVVAACLINLTMNAAAAYLDPTVAGYSTQVLAGGILAVLLVARRSWNWLKTELLRLRAK